jgi:16S rRNA G966 N2-methylase RsmD
MFPNSHEQSGTLAYKHKVIYTQADDRRLNRGCMNDRSLVKFGRECKALASLGWDNEDIGSHIGILPTLVETLLTFQELPSEIHSLIDSDVLTFSTVLQALEVAEMDIDRAMQHLRPLMSQAKVLARDRRCVLKIDDCTEVLAKLASTNDFCDAIITDPPYEIGFHGREWDRTGISFSSDLWNLAFAALKPGGFIAAFSAPRLYHRMAICAEDAGFTIYPFLSWRIPGALPKPANLSELFDRDNLDDRMVIGYRVGSGYTRANVNHGLQGRRSDLFPIYARHVSPEAQNWRGYFYGMTALAPSVEPILLAQKPIAHKRMIDNIRRWGTGALNIGALQARYGGAWPGLSLRHARDHRENNVVGYTSVKPVSLMEDLCLLLCPTGGHIIDPFAGTGSTGVAALRCGYTCMLIEQDHTLKPVIERRLDQESVTRERVSVAV